jgi:transcriptional regulator with XRE-family HTH domain
LTDTYAAHAATAEGRLGLAQAEVRYRAVELIEEVLAAEQVTQRELARRLGRSESAVSQVLGGDRNLTLNTLAEYLHVLGRRLDLKAAPPEGRAGDKPAPRTPSRRQAAATAP